MDLLPESFDDELDIRKNRLLKAVSANKALKAWLIVSVIIIILGLVAFFSFKANISTQIETKLRDQYDKEIVLLQEKLEKEQSKYDEEIEKQKESYEKKISNTEEKHEKEIEKKDSTIADLEEKIRLLEVKEKISFDEIEFEIKEVGKLTTLDYHYTYAGTHEDVKTFFKTSIELPWTKNSFIAQWDGVVALGVDLSKVKLNVNENTKTITVSIPNAEIFYHDVDEKSFEVLDEKNNIFNPIDVDDMNNFDIKYEEKIYKKIEDNRLLEDAYENAQILIENILKTDPQITEQYTIKYQKAK